MNTGWLIEEFVRLAVFLAAAGGVILAFLKFGGEKLIEHQFDKSLEGVKSEQARALEQQRFDISASLDRTAKLHQFEFEVLPEAWSRLHIAGGSCREAVQRTISRIQVGGLSEGELAIILTTLEISELDSQHIKNFEGEDRQNIFNQAVDYHRWNIARRDQADYYNYLLSHGIFIQPDLLNKLKTIGKLIGEAVFEYEDMLKHPEPKGADRFRARDAFHSEWSAMIADVEADLHSRLWNSRLTSIDQRSCI